jgi:hypothetical protein
MGLRLRHWGFTKKELRDQIEVMGRAATERIAAHQRDKTEYGISLSRLQDSFVDQQVELSLWRGGQTSEARQYNQTNKLSAEVAATVFVEALTREVKLDALHSFDTEALRLCHEARKTTDGQSSG